MHAGLDVSTFLWRAALEAIDRDDRIKDIFADVDAAVDAADGAPAPEPWPPPPAATS